MYAAFDVVPDSDLVRVADKYLSNFPPNAETRNELQELIWAFNPGPEVPIRFRRETAKAIEDQPIYLRSQGFLELLESLFVLEEPHDFLISHPRNLKWQIKQWVVENNDWKADALFENLGAYTCSDRRFLLLIEGLCSSEVRPEVEEQRGFAATLNQALTACQIQLQEVRTSGGYPVFEAIPTGRGVRTAPKNLIFASSVKPDLRFSDAINNDIEVLNGIDDVLVYDRTVGSEGLTWNALQTWWADLNEMDNEKAKESLYRRLIACLPESSPPQRLLFKSYFKHFKHSVPRLPALLPEVWLHWDPKTVRERGKQALLRFRMDFLMLLPNGVRVVIEVDGMHHYANDDGAANSLKYAAMTGADRDLRLAGYDVYRFGAAELNSTTGSTAVADFFERLFRIHHVNL
ncbi:MAG: hypothetical protein PW792_04485 [Acidobacteriaceae bacterium]|nr:hypothetical protein [Acidobacteriaceae bacterium]